jgi:hypothetical protein
LGAQAGVQALRSGKGAELPVDSLDAGPAGEAELVVEQT